MDIESVFKRFKECWYELETARWHTLGIVGVTKSQELNEELNQLTYALELLDPTFDHEVEIGKLIRSINNDIQAYKDAYEL